MSALARITAEHISRAREAAVIRRREATPDHRHPAGALCTRPPTGAQGSERLTGEVRRASRHPGAQAVPVPTAGGRLAVDARALEWRARADQSGGASSMQSPLVRRRNVTSHTIHLLADGEKCRGQVGLEAPGKAARSPLLG